MVTAKKLYFVGIGGSGMLPLAEIALQRGYEVHGSDTHTSTRLERLANRGAKIYRGHSAHQAQGAYQVIVSSAIPANNPEREFALAQKIPVIHRSDLLASFMSESTCITVSGTHGKTSTTAMIGHLLHELGQNPTVYFGGELEVDCMENQSGLSPIFVAEADESDGSFLKYRPNISVITGIRADHLDYFGSFENIKTAFKTYIGNTAADGRVVIFWDDETLRLISESQTQIVLSYGKTIGSEVRVLSCKAMESGITFKCVVERDLVEVALPVLGEHNAYNAAAALAVVRSLDLDLLAAVKALSTFPGVKRRLSIVPTNGKIKIYDDYAHNPDKIAAAIKAIRTSWPDKKLLVLFEPHRYSRMRTLYNEIISVFSDCDSVLVLPVYAAGECHDVQFTNAAISEGIAKVSNNRSQAVERVAEVLDHIRELGSEDVVLLGLGAGNISRVLYEISQEFIRTSPEETHS